MKTDFDIIIAGGGMVGATLALALSAVTPKGRTSPLSIAVIEQSPPGMSSSASFDARAIALGFGSAQILKSYGVWNDLQQFTQAIEHIHVSDKGYPGKVRMAADTLNVPALGYVIEVSDLGNVVLDAVKQKRNVSWFQPHTIASVDFGQQQVTVTLNDESELTGSLLLGCDGVDSGIRQLLKIEQHSEQYKQHAIVTTVQTDKPHLASAYERFTDTGPLALLPLTDNRLSVVWTVTDDEIDTINQYSDTEFLAALQQRFGYQLGTFNRVGRRVSYPLQLLRADSLCRHRSALVGNACHTIHPIAGQGFNLGLRDIDTLVNLLSEYQGDVGDWNVLAEYQRLRSDDHNNVITMTDGLVRMFSNQHAPLVVGRNLALMAMNNCSLLNTMLANQAMGRNHGVTHAAS